MNPNSMLWDDISKVPIPDEAKEVIYDSNWKEVLWQTFGLPIAFAKYSLVGGKSLYLDELPDGTPNIRKEDFTGEVVASNLWLDKTNAGDYHYITSFTLTFFKGELVEIKLLSLEKIDKLQYEKNFNDFEAKYKRNLKIRTSWAFLYLYRPYKKVVQFLFRIPIGLLTFLRWGLIWILRLITPL